MTTRLDELAVAVSIAQVVNLAQITVYPVETVGATSILWTARTVLHIAPGQTRVIHAPFRDGNGARVAGVDVQPLAAGTDYTVNDRADGSGFDYTTNAHITLSMAVEATRAQVTISNTAIGPLYVTLLQVRGRPIRTYDPITVEVQDVASQNTFERRTRSLDLPMQSDPVFAQAYGEYLVGRFAAPVLVAEAAHITGRDVLGGVNVFSLELMDKITVNDTHSGIDTLAHWIRGVEYDLSPESFSVTLLLERADDRRYWLLGTSGYGALDSGIRIGF